MNIHFKNLHQFHVQERTLYKITFIKVTKMFNRVFVDVYLYNGNVDN
jgi:hypothetical protein